MSRHQAIGFLGDLHLLDQSRPTGGEQPAPWGQPNRRSSPGPDAEVLTELIEGGAKLRGRGEASESPHRGVALLDGPVILFNPVVQILVAAMADLASDDPADRLAIGRMGISRDAEGLPFRDLEQPWGGKTSCGPPILVMQAPQHGTPAELGAGEARGLRPSLGGIESEGSVWTHCVVVLDVLPEDSSEMPLSTNRIGSLAGPALSQSFVSSRTSTISPISSLATGNQFVRRRRPLSLKEAGIAGPPGEWTKNAPRRLPKPPCEYVFRYSSAMSRSLS